ncbi:MAG: hypothetical protein KDB00_16630 [Planctomycetales bacterium]|nr:hypothetical protein [Planctomycetales bacterium]
MLLAEPPETAYDFRFNFLGFPVRIAVTFWLGAVVFGYHLCQDFAGEELGIGPLMIAWALCVFISILIHELGHALAFRFYGIQSSIVLYHFGGLAIPTSSYMPGRSISRIGEKQQLIISAAGPGLQLLSALVVVLVIKLFGYEVTAFRFMPSFLAELPWVTDGERMDSRGMLALSTFYLLPSVLWAFLNLVPVWPLDGGQIARSLILMNRGTVAQSLWLSVICSGALVFYALSNQQPMMAIFFAMFGFSSYQMLNPMNNSWR